MDAVEYLKERERMNDENIGGYLAFISGTERPNPVRAVAIVEKWSADHPQETYRTHFLKAFPNAISFGMVCKNAVYNMNQGRCNAGFDAKCPDCWDEPYEP